MLELDIGYRVRKFRVSDDCRLREKLWFLLFKFVTINHFSRTRSFTIRTLPFMYILEIANLLVFTFARDTDLMGILQSFDLRFPVCYCVESNDLLSRLACYWISKRHCYRAIDNYNVRYSG